MRHLVPHRGHRSAPARTRIGRTGVGDTGDENHRSIARLPPRRSPPAPGRQQLRQRQRERVRRPPVPPGHVRSASRPRSSCRSSRSTADTSERGFVSSWISSAIVARARHRSGGAAGTRRGSRWRQQHLDRGRLDVGMHDRIRPQRPIRRTRSTRRVETHDRLDQIDHDQRPFRPPADVADAPRRPAHGRLVPQPGERGERRRARRRRSSTAAPSPNNSVSWTIWWSTRAVFDDRNSPTVAASATNARSRDTRPRRGAELVVELDTGPRCVTASSSTRPWKRRTDRSASTMRVAQRPDSYVASVGSRDAGRRRCAPCGRPPRPARRSDPSRTVRRRPASAPTRRDRPAAAPAR